MIRHYISDSADLNLSELIAQLSECDYAAIDNDCIYFTKDDGEICYEVTRMVCNLVLLALLNIEIESA